MKIDEIVVSEIEILPVKPHNGLVAFSSAVINHQFYIANIAIHTSPRNQLGYRLVYPDKVLSNGKRIDCFHPITQDAGDAVSRAIIRKYVELMSNF